MNRTPAAWFLLGLGAGLLEWARDLIVLAVLPPAYYPIAYPGIVALTLLLGAFVRNAPMGPRRRLAGWCLGLGTAAAALVLGAAHPTGEIPSVLVLSIWLLSSGSLALVGLAGLGWGAVRSDPPAGRTTALWAGLGAGAIIGLLLKATPLWMLLAGGASLTAIAGHFAAAHPAPSPPHRSAQPAALLVAVGILCDFALRHALRTPAPDAPKTILTIAHAGAATLALSFCWLRPRIRNPQRPYRWSLLVFAVLGPWSLALAHMLFRGTAPLCARFDSVAEDWPEVFGRRRHWTGLASAALVSLLLAIPGAPIWPPIADAVHLDRFYERMPWAPPHPAPLLWVVLLGSFAVLASRDRRQRDRYRATLRRALLEDPAATIARPVGLDEGPELDALAAHPSPPVALAALVRRRHAVAHPGPRWPLRAALAPLPAAVLYHPDPSVPVEALAQSPRDPTPEWCAIAEWRCAHGPPAVQIAALWALAGTKASVPRDAESDDDPAVRVHAAYWSEAGPEHPTIEQALRRDAPRAERRALIDAITRGRDARWCATIEALADARIDGERPALAAAMSALGDPRFIPWLVAGLDEASGRDALRRALVAFGDTAVDALSAAFADHTRPDFARRDIIRTLGAMGTERAEQALIDRLDPAAPPRYANWILAALPVPRAGDTAPHRGALERCLTADLARAMRHRRTRPVIESLSPRNHATRDVHDWLGALLRDRQARCLQRIAQAIERLHPDPSHRRLGRAILDSAEPRHDLTAVLVAMRPAVASPELRQKIDAFVEHDPAGTAPFEGPEDTLRMLLSAPDIAIAAATAYFVTAMGMRRLRGDALAALEQRPELSALRQMVLTEFPPEEAHHDDA